MQASSSLLKRSLSFKSNPIPLSLESPHSYTNLLISQCSRASLLSHARNAFDKIPQRTQLSSNCKFLHARIIILGYRLIGSLGNALVDLYSKNGDLGSARKVFSLLKERTTPVRNSILSSYLKQGLFEDVVDAFVSMHRSGCLPDQFGFATVLTAFARTGNLLYGKVVHCQIIKYGLDRNPFCEGSLINMHVKCGCTFDARSVFDRIECPDMISCTTMIEGYVRIGKGEEALQLFSRMQSLGMKPDCVTFVTVITACVSLGQLENAGDLCRNMPFPNVVAWNAIISGNLKYGHEDKALELFHEMRMCDLKPSRSTFGSVLSAIASLVLLDEGRVVHCEAIKLGLDSNVFVASSLINMYSKCHVLEDARRLFDVSSERNVVMWNSIIGGYLQNEQPMHAIEMFLEMKGHKSELDEVTLVSLFGACASLENLELGRQLHCVMIKRNLEANLVVDNAIIDMYGKFGELNDAKRMFELLPNRDNFSWNAIIAGYARNEAEDEAMRLFQRMSLEGAKPDEVSFASVISASTNFQAFEQGAQLHCLAIKLNLSLCSYVGSSLIYMYAKFGKLEDAKKVLTEMPEKTVVSRNALIAGHAQNKKEQEALNMFRQMQIYGIEPSQFTYASVLPACNGPWGLYTGKQIHCHLLKSDLLNGCAFLNASLLSMYLKSKSLEDANNLFLEIPKNKNKVLWTTIISGNTQNGYSDEALVLFWRMRDHNVIPDESTFSSVLKACADLASIRDGKEIHGLVTRTGFISYRYTSSALIDMYSKCGDIGSSYDVFEELNNKQDKILWNPMIVGFAKNGLAEESLLLFHKMRELKITPDDVTFLGVLSACSHAGLGSQGRGFFTLMSKKYGITPRNDHYACIIDLFCRGGFLKEAEEFIDALPFEPDGVIWATLLSACRVHGDEIRGKHAAEKLICLEPHNSSPYVLLSNIYAADGNWAKAKVLRRVMRERGVRKSPGCSWIEVGNNTSSFVAEDKLHSRAVEIYETLEDLSMEMKEEGYVAELD